LLILFKDRVFPEVLEVGLEIAEKTGWELEVFAKELPAEELKKHLPPGVDIPIITGGNFEEVLEREKPYLALLPRPKVSPFIHIFKKPWSEKLVESTDRWNFLLIQEGSEKIEKALLYVDRDIASENYIRETYDFLTRWGVEFHFVTVFDERYYEVYIKKEHPEQEARELLGQMFEDYVEAVRRKIKEALGLEKVEIIPLKGEVRKTLPYFAKRHRYDLLVFPHAHPDKVELIENSETSVAVFKN